MGELAIHKEEVVRLYRLGMSCSAIAKRYAVVTAAVTQLLNRNGVRAIRHGGQHRLSDVQQGELSRRYAAGEVSGVLCKEFGISQCTVREIAKRHGVLSKPVGVQKKYFSAEDRAVIADAYRQGELPADIAERFGTSRQTLVSVLVSERLITPRIKSASKFRHTDGNGYWLVRLSIDDPMAGMRYSNGYVLEHRLAMARHLGRPLVSTETVHHIDGNVMNNHPSNLQLRQGRHGKHVCMACLDCGSRNVGPIPIDEPKAAQ